MDQSAGKRCGFQVMMDFFAEGGIAAVLDEEIDIRQLGGLHRNARAHALAVQADTAGKVFSCPAHGFYEVMLFKEAVTDDVAAGLSVASVIQKQDVIAHIKEYLQITKHQFTAAGHAVAEDDNMRTRFWVVNYEGMDVKAEVRF